jgi:hypothetical protein
VPVRAFRHAVLRQLREFRPDFVERQTDAPREHAPQDSTRKAAMPGAGSLGPNQPLLLIETQRRCG